MKPGDAGDLRRLMLARSRAVRHECANAAQVLAPVMERESKRVLTDEIYSVPIPLKASADHATDLSKVPVQLQAQVLKNRKFEKPLSATSKMRQNGARGQYGKWQRTGNLRRLEKARAQGVAIVMTNPAAYSVPRNNLGTANGRKIKSPGIRSCQWQLKAVVNKRGVILQVRRQHVLKALRQP